jgi:signal transduction histidine kinase
MNRFNSIRRQVMLFAVLICLGVLVPVGAVLLINHISQFKTKLSESFQATTRIMATNASAALAFGDEAAAKELLASLVNAPSITAAALYATDGTRLVTYGETPLTPPPPALSDGFSSKQEPVSYKGENYGRLLVLSRYPEELRGTIVAWVSVYAGAIALAGAIAALLAARFYRAVATPLQSLANTAGDVTTSQNYAVRVPLDGPREIRELAQAFNTMMTEIDRRDAELEEKSQVLSHQLKALRKEVEEREAAEQRLRENNREMMRLSREAGMAEVATGVLHNIGNALNSINVSTELLCTQIHEQSRVTAATLRDFFTTPPENAAAVFSTHPVGPGVLTFASSLARLMIQQMEESARELAALRAGVVHLKQIVSRQQSLAKTSTLSEAFNLGEAVQDALLLSKADTQGLDLKVEHLADVPAEAYADRSAVVQILINLIANARESMNEAGQAEKKLVIRVGAANHEHVFISITDNGSGIASDQLVAIFSYGFTTKKQGHGFGLHNSANTARLMGGVLQVHSPGRGQGATFTLTLPRRPLPAP